ncbi:hypothetical protein M427DRAFT_259727 [Gonapodya prolifera JEL478]|uniref:PAS domain-containing protein n=1 Tax=Gonapodya prolifera (strain JEL478) TaxID=1344416 RepID=A0A139AKP7_GONPJ|nr:hypothetical protein M427DRAFT_259727 [Gonapodya prolifera JEL478]|eukprot:KXS17347.1 hypothetical protein M427DRAFT_259727 [Gonapodya prolifera JEL478]
MEPASEQPSTMPSPFVKGQLLSGVYSTSGFDTLGVLTRVYSRKNPKIHLGPIDCDTSFVIVDAKLPDYPIVHISENFTRLTGYSLSQVLGRNCRFLQSPDGRVQRGAVRLHCDNAVIYDMKKSVERHEECQYTQVNYKQDGTPFVNLITIIPLCWNDDDDITFFVGFQVDLEEQSRRILGRMAGGTYSFPTSLGAVTARPSPATGGGARLLPPGIDAFSRSMTPNAALPVVELDGRDVAGMLFPDLHKKSVAVVEERAVEQPKPVVEMNVDQAVAEVKRPLPSSMASVRAAKHVQERLEVGPATGQAAAPVPPTVAPRPTLVARRPVARPTVVPSSLSDPASAQLLAESHGDLTFIVSSRGIFLHASQGMCKDWTGYDPEEIVGLTLNELCHANDMPNVARELRGSRVHSDISVVWRIIRADGSYLWLDSTGHKYELDNRKRTKCFVLSCRPRTVETALEPEHTPGLSGFARLTATPPGATSSGWMRVSREGFVLYANPAASEILTGVPGEDSGAVYGNKVAELVDSEFAISVSQAVQSAADRPDLGPVRREVRLADQFGTWARLEMHALGGSGAAWQLFVVIEKVDGFSPYEEAGMDTDAVPDMWNLLKVADQSSLNHKGNWLKSHNRRLEEELAALGCA